MRAHVVAAVAVVGLAVAGRPVGLAALLLVVLRLAVHLLHAALRGLDRAKGGGEE